MNKMNKHQIGDEVYSSNTDKTVVNTAAFDSLDDECWNLFKGYTAALGISLEDENGNPYEGIDFSITAEIRDKVVQIIENSGITVMPDTEF